MCGTTPQIISHIEAKGKNDLPVTPAKFNEIMNKAEAGLKFYLRGKQAGEPKLNKREREELDKKIAEEKKAAKAEAKKAKEEEEKKKAEEAEKEAREKEEEQAKKEAEEKEKSEIEHEDDDTAATSKALGKAKLADDDEEAEE